MSGGNVKFCPSCDCWGYEREWLDSEYLKYRHKCKHCGYTSTDNQKHKTHRPTIGTYFVKKDGTIDA